MTKSRSISTVEGSGATCTRNCSQTQLEVQNHFSPGLKKTFQIVTHICYKVSLFHGLVDLNILGDILGPSEHFPSEKIPGGKMAISKLA